MSNPIANAFDRTVENTITDERRPLKGFLEMVKPAAQFHRVHAMCQAMAVDGSTSGRDLSDVVHHIVVVSLWLGFEAGKSYVINGDLERILALEDEWDRKQSESPSQSETT